MLPNIELFVSDVIEGQPVNISCEASNGRPRYNLTLYVDNAEIATETEESYRNESDTFSKSLTLTSVHKEWNGKGLKCCASSEFINTEMCSPETRIVYLST